jgi:hypothetical protein
MRTGCDLVLAVAVRDLVEGRAQRHEAAAAIATSVRYCRKYSYCYYYYMRTGCDLVLAVVVRDLVEDRAQRHEAAAPAIATTANTRCARAVTWSSQWSCVVL